MRLSSTRVSSMKLSNRWDKSSSVRESAKTSSRSSRKPGNKSSRVKILMVQVLEDPKPCSPTHTWDLSTTMHRTLTLQCIWMLLPTIWTPTNRSPSWGLLTHMQAKPWVNQICRVEDMHLLFLLLFWAEETTPKGMMPWLRHHTPRSKIRDKELLVIMMV